MATIFTIGHSTKSFDTYLQKLKENSIDMLADVRTFPRSRFNPHFNEKRLKVSLEAKGIQYTFYGKNLGGRGINENYDEAIDELVKQVKNGKNVCVMCSEGDYHMCHRYTMLTPSFLERGLDVIHIEYEKDNKKSPR